MKKRSEAIQYMDGHLVALRDEMHRDLAEEDAFEALEEMEAHMRELRRRKGAVVVTTVYDGVGNMIDQSIEPLPQQAEPGQADETDHEAGDLSDLNKKVGEL